MNYRELEICVFSVEAAIAAQKAGADRVELCSGFTEGGLTPSAGAIRMVRKLLNIECFVMIRPRGGDFCYSDMEFEQMHHDIEFAKSCGVDGIVLGVLQPNGHVNITRTRELVQHAAPLQVTFHRAFDLAVDPFRALDDIVICGCRRILTSGQKATAVEGLDIIKKLVAYSAGRIDIMAGSGVYPENVHKFVETGVQALHFSAKKIKPSGMIYRNQAVTIMQAGAMSDYDLLAVDEDKIRKILKKMKTSIVNAAVICCVPAIGACTGNQKDSAPNIILIMADDMGFSDIGCYGGEVCTPNIDQLAQNGIRFRSFYNNAKSCPTRASLMTGLFNHEAGMGNMTTDVEIEPPGPYQGYLNENCVTIAQVLKDAGYATYMSGKWHLGEKKQNWPLQHGFDKYFGLISGASSFFEIIKERRERVMAYDHESWTPPSEGFYMTQAFSDSAVAFINRHDQTKRKDPFFLYLAYTAPHWPLHALNEDIAKYAGRYDAGWDEIRNERYQRMLEMGIIDEKYRFTERTEGIPAWSDVDEKELWTRRMQVYAAQIDRMDQGIGQLIDALKKRNMLDNTLIIFLSDNGGCAENPSSRNLAIPGIPVGEKGSYDSYQEPWANASNTPFRLYKNWLYEGGIRTPLIMHWPAKIRSKGEITTHIGHVVDIMSTCMDVAGTKYPDNYNGKPLKSLRGESLLPVITGKPFNRNAPFFWEYSGHLAMRDGNMKIVKSKGQDWELYDLENDPTELINLSASQPEILNKMTTVYQNWAKETGIKQRRDN